MGLNAFFVYTVCFGFVYSWQHALSMVIICGIVNIIITVTKLRKHIIKAIPKTLQHAISGGIGVFIAYIGLINAGLINVGGAVPAMAELNTPSLWLFLIGLFLIVILTAAKVKGAILISIIVTAVIGIPMGVTATQDTVSFSEAARALPTTFGVIFTRAGLGSLFSGGASRALTAVVTIFSFSVTDTFDTIGTFIGTGRRSGIFSEKDERAMEKSAGFKTKMDKALFADAVATSVGAVFGTSNTTTYVESAAGISAGGRTGLTGVVVALCFVASAFMASFVSAIPYAATSPALVIVGVMMISSFSDVKWVNIEDAVPAFFAGAFMALSYSITHGIAAAFIFYCVVKLCAKKRGDIHPILAVSTLLFILNFVLQAAV
jgi:AGZA family xanthine/uracil permease-like MFS transporter